MIVISWCIHVNTLTFFIFISAKQIRIRYDLCRIYVIKLLKQYHIIVSSTKVLSPQKHLGVFNVVLEGSVWPGALGGHQLSFRMHYSQKKQKIE